MNYKCVLIIAIGFSTFVSFAQSQPQITKSNSVELIRALNSSTELAQNSDDYLSVRIYSLDNGSGSAGLPESHEVNFNLLVAVSGFDEQPEQALFEIGPFANPKFIEWTEINKYSKKFKIEYGLKDSRDSAIITVDLNELLFNK